MDKIETRYKIWSQGKNKMVMSSVFGDVFTEFDQFDRLVNQVNSNISKAIKESPTILNIPMDKYTDENKSLVFEIALTGISKEDFKTNGKVTTQIKEGNNFLVIKYTKPKSEEPEPEREYIGQRKIKHMDNFEHAEYISANYDVSQLKLSLNDGLLTIVIPVKEEVKPVEYTLE